MTHRRTFWAACCLGMALCAGCESAATPAAETLAPAKGAEPSTAPAPAADEALTPSIEDTTFRLALADAGEQGVVLTLEARGGYHINQEFPFNAALSSDSLELPKASLAKDDAREFGETQARFPVITEVPAGEHEIVANVRFAVCTDETCVPDKRKLALRVTR